MKVAITSGEPRLDVEIHPHFGRARYLLLVETEDLSFEVIENPHRDLSQGVGIPLARLAAHAGPEAVLTGQCDPSVLDLLTAAEVLVVTNCRGTVREAIEVFRVGEPKRGEGPPDEGRRLDPGVVAKPAEPTPAMLDCKAADPSPPPPATRAGPRVPARVHHRIRRRGTHVDPSRIGRAARNRADITRGLAALGLGIVAACAGLLWWSDVSAHAEMERVALQERRQVLHDELLGENALTPAEARALLARIAATREQWVSASFAPAIGLRKAEARRVLEADEVDRALAVDLATLEHDLAVCGPEPLAWQVLRGRADALGQRASKASAEVQARIAAAVTRIDGGWFQALVARGTAADVAAAEATTWLVQAVDFAEERMAETRSREVAQPWQERLRELAPLFDTAQRRCWTPATVAAVPWQELPLHEEEWVTSCGGNMTRSMTDGALQLTCAAGERSRGGTVILRHHDWHDAVIGCDLRLEHGAAVLLPRVHEQFRAGGGIELATGPTAAATVVPTGRTVHVEMTIVGDHVVATVAPTAHPAHVEVTVVGDHVVATGSATVERHIATFERRGSLGLILQPGTAVAIDGLRVRRLD